MFAKHLSKCVCRLYCIILFWWISKRRNYREIHKIKVWNIYI